MPLFSLFRLSWRSFAVTCGQASALRRLRPTTGEQLGKSKEGQTYVFGPYDVRCEHESQVEGGHLVFVLLLGGLVEQVQQQLEEAAVGWREQHEEELQGFDLALFVRHRRLVAFLVELRDLCETRRRQRTFNANMTRVLVFACLDRVRPFLRFGLTRKQ